MIQVNVSNFFYFAEIRKFTKIRPKKNPVFFYNKGFLKKSSNTKTWSTKQNTSNPTHAHK